MRKCVKTVLICMVLTLSFWCMSLIRDRSTLNEQLIRLHVVANSDSKEDQAVKLQVRDAVLKSIEKDLKNVADVAAAKKYLQENLPKIRNAANVALEKAGVDMEAAVTLCKETFDTRYYDTFTLPAGVYEALRIVIGDGKGQNWWCVTFPSLCVPAVTEEFETAAVGAGFSNDLTCAMAGEERYEIRFFLLDAMGKVDNILFKG